MATVKKATYDLFEKAYPLVDHFNVRGYSKEDWRQLFSQKWSSQHDHYGYLLMDGDKAVGFLGAFFHERNIQGEVHQLCNLYGWHVLEGYRQESLLLILAGLNLKNTTLTGLTTTGDNIHILKKFKFTPLETTVKIFSQLSALGKSVKGELHTEPETILANLNQQEQQIFKDHSLPFFCRHAVFVSRENPADYCYLVFNKVRKKHIGFTQIYHVSNPELFQKCFPRLQRFFLRSNYTLFTVIDKRLLKGHEPGWGLDYTLRYPRLHRSAGLMPEQVDNLYSELLFLKQI